MAAAPSGGACDGAWLRVVPAMARMVPAYSAALQAVVAAVGTVVGTEAVLVAPTCCCWCGRRRRDGCLVPTKMLFA